MRITVRLIVFAHPWERMESMVGGVLLEDQQVFDCCKQFQRKPKKLYGCESLYPGWCGVPVSCEAGIHDLKNNCSTRMLSSECAPTEIRTPVLALKGLRPGPLDDGGIKARFYHGDRLAVNVYYAAAGRPGRMGR